MRKFIGSVLLIAVSALAVVGCSTLNVLLGDQVTFSQPQLQHALNRNFPKHYDELGGLVSLTLTNPRLWIPEDEQRLQLDFDVGLSALGSDSLATDGHFSLSSSLRYDPQTRGLHLASPRIERVDLPALGGVMSASSRELLNSWLTDYAREEPVYRFDNTLLDRLGARRIDTTTIEDGQVVVHLDD